MPATHRSGKRQHIDLAVARRLKLMRQILGFSATELDRRCGYGPGTIGRLERGNQRIYANHLFRLSEITGISIDFFFTGIEDPAGSVKPDMASEMEGFDGLLQSHNVQEIVERLMRVLAPEPPQLSDTPIIGPINQLDTDGDAEET